MVSDARTGKRFAVQLPVTIHDKIAKKRATGSNFSAAGVYIWADDDLEVGSPITFDITLPGNVIGAQEDVQIECSGRVVRAERKSPSGSNGTKNSSRSSRRGVACVIDQYKFIRR